MQIRQFLRLIHLPVSLHEANKPRFNPDTSIGLLAAVLRPACLRPMDPVNGGKINRRGVLFGTVSRNAADNEP